MSESPHRTSEAEIDAAAFRQALGHYPTGVCVVTAMVDDEPVGMVVGSFSSVSLSPPLVAFMPDKSSTTFGTLRRATHFTANILSSSQVDVCRRLSSKTIADKWDGITWSPGPSGSPILDDAVAWIDCEFERTFDAGDHLIVMGLVRDSAVQSDRLPLLFFQGAYGRFSPASFVARSGADFLPQLELAEAIREELENLSSNTGLECTASALVDTEVIVVARSGNPAGANPRRTVGHRFPFIPPLTSIFCAWDADLFDVWIRQLTTSDEEIIESLRAQVDRVRQRGWSMSLRSPGHPELDGMLSEFAAGTYTPAAERQYRSLIESQRGYFDTEEIVPGSQYNLYSLRAPVFDRQGRVALGIQLVGPDWTVSGSQVLEWRDALLESSHRMTATITSSPSVTA